MARSARARVPVHRTRPDGTRTRTSKGAEIEPDRGVTGLPCKTCGRPVAHTYYGHDSASVPIGYVNAGGTSLVVHCDDCLDEVDRRTTRIADYYAAVLLLQLWTMGKGNPWMPVMDEGLSRAGRA